MAPVVPTTEPTAARAGETWLWDIDYADYPRSEGWVLTYEVRGVARITLGAGLTTAYGEGWHVIVPATTTTDYPAGSYEFTAVLTGSGTYAGRVQYVPLERLVILPNLITAAAGDRLTWAERVLVDVEAALAARAKGDNPEFYAVDGTSVKSMSTADLNAWRLKLTQEIASLRAPQQFGRQINHRFVPASR